MGVLPSRSLRVISQVASTGGERETLTKFELNTIAFLKDRVLTAPPYADPDNQPRHLVGIH